MTSALCHSCGQPLTAHDELSFGRFRLVRADMAVYLDGAKHHLGPGEFLILWRIVSRKGSIAPMQWLAEAGEVRDAIKRIRRTLGTGDVIESVYGQGYRLAVDPDEVFSDRRAREKERAVEEKAERDKKAEEDRARRERAPINVGNGRIFKS